MWLASGLGLAASGHCGAEQIVCVENVVGHGHSFLKEKQQRISIVNG
jgi:hypothetical protein